MDVNRFNVLLKLIGILDAFEIVNKFVVSNSGSCEEAEVKRSDSITA